MPNKCEGCKHYSNPLDQGFWDGGCENEKLLEAGARRIPVSIKTGRSICDKEGDGIFVYFEPKSHALTADR